MDTDEEKGWVTKKQIDKHPGLFAPYLYYLHGVNLEVYAQEEEEEEEEDTEMAVEAHAIIHLNDKVCSSFLLWKKKTSS